jgi:uncharacterized protein
MDLTIWSVIEVLAESKFITILSMLFGAGVVLMTSRVEHRGIGPARLHYRRMSWLLVSGLIHAWLWRALTYGHVAPIRRDDRQRAAV